VVDLEILHRVVGSQAGVVTVTNTVLQLLPEERMNMSGICRWKSLNS
jgi:hypothetical protein